MIIRKAEKKDYNAIYNLVQIAFETAKVKDGTEQDFVYELRKRDTYIEDLEFVAVEDNELIGHIMLTKQFINSKSSNINGLLVAPLCVKLEYRSKGIGGQLLNYAITEARKLGYNSAFLAGDPNYYSRYGFRNIEEFKIKNITDIPNQYIQIYEFNKGEIENIEGEINLC